VGVMIVSIEKRGRKVKEKKKKNKKYFLIKKPP